MVDPGYVDGLSITRQCRLLSINRSSYCYRHTGETPLNLELMCLIDAHFLETPCYGARQMARQLRRIGYCVSRKRIGRLMRVMGLFPIYQRPNTSKPHPDHKIYPYLLRDMKINTPNRVWCSDITYSAPSPWRRWGKKCCQGLSMSGMHKDSNMNEMNRMPAFRYGKARAEAEVICRALAE